jgi:hypothetical protein
VAIRERVCSRVAGQRPSDVFRPEECEHMTRQWLKILMLVLALLSQMAMACPRDAGQQSSGDASSGGPMQRGGGGY